jgi:hypothetical protein
MQQILEDSIHAHLKKRTFRTETNCYSELSSRCFVSREFTLCTFLAKVLYICRRGNKLYI